MAMSVPDGDNRKFVYYAVDIEIESGRLLKDGDNKKVLLGYNFGQEENGKKMYNGPAGGG